MVFHGPILANFFFLKNIYIIDIKSNKKPLRAILLNLSYLMTGLYVKKCVNTRFEMASSLLQDKWLDDQFQTWTQIITVRILSDPGFKQALLDSADSPLFDPEEPVYATALTSARKMCVQGRLLTWPSWITIPTRATRGQVLA